MEQDTFGYVLTDANVPRVLKIVLLQCKYYVLPHMHKDKSLNHQIYPTSHLHGTFNITYDIYYQGIVHLFFNHSL